MAQAKTNAMRQLDSNHISYNIYTYENKDGKIDGISVAEKIKKEVQMVYKTLVVKDGSNGIYVFIIPVADELDLKKAAKAVNAKKIELVPVKDIQKLTGYIRGGCSPIGMKKHYPTIIHAEADNLYTIIVSGGKIGMQMEISISDLKAVTEAKMADVVHV